MAHHAETIEQMTEGISHRRFAFTSDLKPVGQHRFGVACDLCPEGWWRDVHGNIISGRRSKAGSLLHRHDRFEHRERVEDGDTDG